MQATNRHIHGVLDSRIDHRSSSGVVLSSWLAEQELRGSIPGLAMILEIGYLLLQSPGMAKILPKRFKSSEQPTNQESIIVANITYKTFRKKIK